MRDSNRSRPRRLPRALLPVLVAGALAGCQTAGEGAGGGIAEERVYESFPPGAPQNCIDVKRIDSLEAIGNHTLLFRMHNDDVWRNRLKRSCPGMRRDTTFLYEVVGSRLCANEFVYQLDRIGSDFRRGVACALGKFDYLTEDQAQALESLR